MRSGYNQSGASVIPADWKAVQLGDHVRITSGESPSTINFVAAGKPYFKVEQLGNSSKYLNSDASPYHFIHGKTVQKNSVVFAKRGAAIALNRVRILSEESFMDTNLMALSPENGLDSEFLYYELGYIGLWQFADTTSVPQINNKHVKPLVFPLPSISEQRAIATALSDVDALLDGLALLIAKKRDLKQATMQQLLTGQTRLPGFSGGWVVKRLDEIGDCFAGGTPSTTRADYWGGNVLWLPSGRVQNHILNAPSESEITITQLGLAESAAKTIKANSVLVAITGATCANVALLQFEAAANQSVVAIEPFECADARFLYYALLMERDQILSRQSGSAQGGVNLKTVKGIEINAPSPPEQTAIATVLSDLDAELAALEARLTKTRAMKQAMMSELLTGKTRLPTT